MEGEEWRGAVKKLKQREQALWPESVLIEECVVLEDAREPGEVGYGELWKVLDRLGSVIVESRARIPLSFFEAEKWTLSLQAQQPSLPSPSPSAQMKVMIQGKYFELLQSIVKDFGEAKGEFVWSMCLFVFNINKLTDNTNRQ